MKPSPGSLETIAALENRNLEYFKPGYSNASPAIYYLHNVTTNITRLSINIQTNKEIFFSN